MKPNHDLAVHAFVDDELDVAARLEMERAIASDAVLGARVDELRTLRRAIRDDAEYHRASEAFHERIAALAATRAAAASDAPPRRPDTPGASPAPSRGRGWRPPWTALAATVALTIGTQWYLAHDRSEARLVDEVVASHVRATLGEHPIDIASSDHHTVKPWLSSKLDFSPPVRDTGIGSANFVGGRIDYLDGRPVAALVYRQGQHLVDAFVWPGDGERGITYTSERGYRIAHWTHARMQHWVVSDVGHGEFVALVERLAAPDEVPSTPTR